LFLSCLSQTFRTVNNSCRSSHTQFFSQVLTALQNYKNRPLASFCRSVRLSVWSHETNSTPTGGIFLRLGIFVKLIFEIFSKTYRKKCKFHYNLTIITGTLHGDVCTFVIISRSVLVRVRNISDKICREIQNTIYVQ